MSEPQTVAEPRVGHPAPQRRYEIHHGLFEPDTVVRTRTSFERGIQEIVAQEELESETIRRVVSAWGKEQPWVKAAVHEFAPIVQSALAERGSEMANHLGQVVDASLFVMTREQGGGTHAHQDLAYKWNKPLNQRYAYTTWIALDDCDADSGALRICDGFQMHEVGPRQDFLRRDFIDLATTHEWISREILAAVEAGSVVVFDSLTWHASSRLNTAGQRRALAIRWRSTSGWEDQVQIKNPTIDPSEFGMETSGRLLCEAIVDAFQEIAPNSPTQGNTLRVLKQLRHHGKGSYPNLGRRSQTALHDLECALDLQERHQARPSAAVWREIRDVVLPSIQAPSAGGRT